MMAEKPAVRKNAVPGESAARHTDWVRKPGWWEPWERAEPVCELRPIESLVRREKSACRLQDLNRRAGEACSLIQAFASVVQIAASPALRAKPRLCGPWANMCTAWGTLLAASADASR